MKNLSYAVFRRVDNDIVFAELQTALLTCLSLESNLNLIGYDPLVLV